MQIEPRILALGRTFGEGCEIGLDPAFQVEKLAAAVCLEFGKRDDAHFVLRRCGRAHRSLHAAGICADGGGRIACDRNEEKEGYALAAMSRRGALNCRL